MSQNSRKDRTQFSEELFIDSIIEFGKEVEFQIAQGNLLALKRK